MRLGDLEKQEGGLYLYQCKCQVYFRGQRRDACVLESGRGMYRMWNTRVYTFFIYVFFILFTSIVCIFSDDSSHVNY